MLLWLVRLRAMSHRCLLTPTSTFINVCGGLRNPAVLGTARPPRHACASLAQVKDEEEEAVCHQFGVKNMGEVLFKVLLDKGP